MIATRVGVPSALAGSPLIGNTFFCTHCHVVVYVVVKRMKQTTCISLLHRVGILYNRLPPCIHVSRLCTGPFILVCGTWCGFTCLPFLLLFSSPTHGRALHDNTRTLRQHCSCTHTRTHTHTQGGVWRPPHIVTLPLPLSLFPFPPSFFFSLPAREPYQGSTPPSRRRWPH